jgi:hypothetical protein
MPQDIFTMVAGLAGSVTCGVLLWFAAKISRNVKMKGSLDGDATITGVALLLTIGFLVALAITITGFIHVSPEPILGILAGLASTIVAMGITVKVLGPLPKD